MLLLAGCSTVFTFEPDEAPVALAPEDTAVVEATRARLLINEVQSANDSTVMDPDLNFPDWVELYNAGDTPIPLNTVSVSDGLVSWTGSGGELPAGDRVLLWADGAEAPGHLPFTLDAGGARLTVTVHDVVTDRLATGQLAGDTAWARYPDGGTFAVTARPTPNETNGSDPGQSLDPSDLLFDEGVIREYALTLSDASLDALGYDPYGEVDATLAWGPVWFPHVSVRLKGVYGSLRSLSAKAAFKVDLNEYEDHRLRGLETLTFNNMVQDPTYTHEALAYQFYRLMGLPAPRTAWMRLSINGEDWGLYLHVESIDDTFLARWWADPSGRMYEGSYGDDFTIGEEDDFEYDEGPLDDDRTCLTEVATILDGAADDAGVRALEELVDLDQVLTELAVEAALVHWDGYTTANNYRIYQDPADGRFDMIPWGTDQTLHDVWYGPYDGYGELLQYCLANAACTARYELALLEAADALEGAALDTALDAYVAFLADNVADDPRGEHSATTIATYVDDTRTVILDGPERIRAAVLAR